MAAGFLHQCTPQSTLLALSAPANLSYTAMAPKRTSPAAKTEDPKQEALQLERKWHGKLDAACKAGSASAGAGVGLSLIHI